MADISIRDVSKTYPGQGEPANDKISLDVADGEFMVFLGPSGCGKTTLLRAIAGLDFPDSGAISIGGRDVTYLPPRERNLSMVFQSYAVFPHRRVRANIGFGLAMRKMPKAEIAERVERAADLLQLRPYLDRFPAQLSGGQRQRVAVARAIVMDADVLLMDEPLSNLDALLRLSFRTELKKIVQQLGMTTVYVTHDQAEALSLGDRVAVMREGRIVQLGHPIDVYDHPADTFVGGFLGSPPMNHVTGTVHIGDDGPSLAVGDARIAVPASLAGLGGKDVLLGVRAENIHVGTEASPGAVRAEVEVVEPVGSAVLLTVAVGGTPMKVQAPPTFRTDPGSAVWLGFPADRLRFYDPETTLALETSS